MRVLETRDPPKNFIPKEILRRKIYELVERRNEWTDWHGSTSVISRGKNYSNLRDVDTLDVLQGLAERRRKPGSVFLIKVMPVLVLQNDQHCLLIGERDTKEPLAGLMKCRELKQFCAQSWQVVFSTVMSFCVERRSAFILSVEERSSIGRLESFGAERPCFNFESYPGRRGASLGWASMGRVSTDELDAFMCAVRRKKDHDKKLRAMKVSSTSSLERPKGDCSA